MKTATTRQRLKRIRASSTRSAQQEIARAQSVRVARQAALDAAVASLDAEETEDIALMTVHDTCRLRMLPELRKLAAQVSEAEATVDVHRESLMHAWRQEKLAEEMVENEAAEVRVHERRLEDSASSEAGVQLWWRDRAA